ncbi:MAG: HAMP domain-containing protein [Planctomycetota bacterium]
MTNSSRYSNEWIPIWIRRRIGLQLIIGSTVIFGVVLALFQVHSIAQDREALYAQLDREGMTLARTVSASCVEALLVEDYPVLVTNLRLLVEKAAHVESAQVERADGRVVAAYPQFVGGGGDDRATPIFRTYDAPVRIDVDGDDLGQVRLEISTAPTEVLLEARVTRLARDVTLAFLMLSGLLAYLIRQMIGKRLHRLAEFAERVGDGELDRSLSIQGIDELSQLGDTLETMRTKLEASDESPTEELTHTSRVRRSQRNTTRDWPAEK